MLGIKSKTNKAKLTATGVDTGALGSKVKTAKVKETDKLVPTDKLVDAARQGKVLSGEKFAMFKKAGRGLWSAKGGLAAGVVLGGGAVAAGLLHSQWLPTALHLATTPVGIGVLAGIAGLALLVGGLYIGRQLTSSVKNALANNARKAVKQEKSDAKQAKNSQTTSAGNKSEVTEAKTSEVITIKAHVDQATAQNVAKLAEQAPVVANKAILETASSEQASSEGGMSRQVSGESNYSDALVQRELSNSTTLSGLMKNLDREQIIASHRAA